MKSRVPLQTAIYVTKLAIRPIACWPLSPDASPSDVLQRNVFWGFSVIHLMACCIPSMYQMYQNRNDADVIVRVLAEIAALVSVIIKMVICKVEETRLQGLIGDMQVFLKQANEKETEVIQFYVDKCLYFHASVLIFIIFGLIAFIAGPLVTSQPLPGDVAYPFSIEPTWIWASLYISQILIISQVGCMAILDFMFGILLWFAGARCEILSLELEWATNAEDITRCIRKHQELLDYVARLSATTRIMALEVSATVLIGITSAGLVIIRNPPWFVLAKYAFFELIAVLELFMYSWPANNLIEKGEGIGYNAYGCAWIGKSPKMMKDISIIMQRSHIPLKISISGLLPTLSLEFYGSVMSTSFSYLTTLRAITDK